MIGDSELATNPYVGPRAFEEGERRFFYGREEETAILAGLVMARRAALFFAQSGAGKSSLLRAGLIPELTRPVVQGRRARTHKGSAHAFQKMRVLPIATVGGAIPGGLAAEPDNVFTFSALFSMSPAAHPASLVGMTLEQGLAQPLADLAEETPAAGASLLIFDQFEQLFTAHPQRWPEREVFFQQVAQALQTFPGLHVLFTMREDFIAELTPFAHLLPEGLRPRFRLERLQREAAITAVVKPAREAGREYATGVAEGLVDNLRRSQSRRQQKYASQPSSNGESLLAEYVEPVHLQIVCRQLWAHLPENRKIIEAVDVQWFGDVDQALSDFYEATLVKTTEQTPVGERMLRRWFDEQLITPAHTRALVYRDQEHSGGLPNEAVAILNDAYLIRAHIRGDDIWYELVHDRLVEPILAANQRWRAQSSHPFAEAAQRWLEAGRDVQQLLSGPSLAQAQAFAEAHPHDVLEEEQAFLAESRRAQEKQQQLEQERLRRRNTIVAGAALLLLLIAFAVWAQRSAAEAERQAQIAASRELAAAAVVNLTVDPELSIMLALAANDRARTEQSEDALRQALFTSRLNRRLRTWSDGGAPLGFEGLDIRRNVQPDDEIFELYSVAMSADGRWIAAAGTGGAIHLWDLDRVEQEAGLVLEVPGGATTWALDFRPQEPRLVTAHEDGVAHVWDVVSGELLLTLGGEGTDPVSQQRGGGWRRGKPARQAGAGEDFVEGHQDVVVSVAYSPDGSRIATGSLDRTIRIWDADTGEPLLAPLIGHVDGITDIAFHPDGERLVSASLDGTIRVWNLNTGEQLFVMEGHEGAVRSVAISQDGRHLASGSLDKTAIIWDLSGEAPVRLTTLYDHTDTVTAVAFSASGHCLATGGPDRIVRVWAVPSGRLHFTLAGHVNWVTSLVFRPGNETVEAPPLAMPCGQELASASRDGSVRLWNVGPIAEVATLAGHMQPVESAVYSPDGRWIASSSDDGVVFLWDSGSGQPLRQWRAHEARVNRATFSPDASLLATAGYDGSARLWNMPSASPAAPPLVHEDATQVHSVAFSPDGGLLATVADDGLARLWQVPSGEAAQPHTLEHGAPVYGVAFSPDASLMATAGADGQVILWDVTTASARQRLNHGGVVYDVAFSPDGRLLASIGWDGTASLWSVESGEREQLLVGHIDRLYGVRFSPDGTTLLTASADGTIRVWGVASGNQQRTLPGPEMNSLDLHPDGQLITVGGEDGAVRIYTLDYNRLLGLANGRLTRSFSDQECQRYPLLAQACESPLVP